ncbi:hypothetical protein ACIGHN_07705 [Acidovorax sp. NPDC077693]|uniref:hypothetical protein n=1 Tax=unclassified Acidovorax TaxID=2684926 RepID=UPI0037C9C424
MERLIAEASKLAPILRGMVECSAPGEGVDIYAPEFEPADGDVFVARAAELLSELARYGKHHEERALLWPAYPGDEPVIHNALMKTLEGRKQ